MGSAGAPLCRWRGKFGTARGTRVRISGVPTCRPSGPGGSGRGASASTAGCGSPSDHATGADLSHYRANGSSKRIGLPAALQAHTPPAPAYHSRESYRILPPGPVALQEEMPPRRNLAPRRASGTAPNYRRLAPEIIRPILPPRPRRNSPCAGRSLVVHSPHHRAALDRPRTIAGSYGTALAFRVRRPGCETCSR